MTRRNLHRPIRLLLGRRLVALSRPEAVRVATLLAGVDCLGSDVSIVVGRRRHTMPARAAVRARRVLQLVLDLGGVS